MAKLYLSLIVSLVFISHAALAEKNPTIPNPFNKFTDGYQGDLEQERTWQTGEWR